MRQTRERMVCDGNISPSPRPREWRHQDGTETSKEGKENNRARSKSKFDIFLSFLICFLSCYHVKFLIPSGFFCILLCRDDGDRKSVLSHERSVLSATVSRQRGSPVRIRCKKEHSPGR